MNSSDVLGAVVVPPAGARVTATAPMLHGPDVVAPDDGPPLPEAVDVAIPAELAPSPAARERYRIAAVRLEQQLGTSPARLAVVTAPSPGPEKSRTSLELARALARDLGRRVLLLDGDPGSTGLEHILGVASPAAAPTELATLPNTLLRLDDEDLFLLTRSTPSRPAGGRALATVAATLRPRFDVVVIDAPALAVSADAATLGRDADGVVLVARAGTTRRDAVVAALDALAGIPIAGWVLHDADGPAGKPPRPPRAPGGNAARK